MSWTRVASCDLAVQGCPGKTEYIRVLSIGLSAQSKDHKKGVHSALIFYSYFPGLYVTIPRYAFIETHSLTKIDACEHLVSHKEV